MATVVAPQAMSLAWAVAKSALTIYTPFWAGIFLAVGITFWIQNAKNKNTTPRTIGQVMTGIGAALFLISGIIMLILIRREMKGNPQISQMFQGLPQSRSARFGRTVFGFPH